MTKPPIDFEFEKKLKKLQLKYLDLLPGKLDDLEKMILDLGLGQASEKNRVGLAKCVHSLKGTAGTYGHGFITAVCQSFEDYFLGVGTQEPIGKDLTDRLLVFVNLLRGYTFTCRQGAIEDLEKFSDRLKALLQGPQLP